MTITEYLAQAQQQLTAAGIDTARLDALILLEDRLQLDRAYLLAHDDAELAPDHVATLQAQLERRAEHVPLAYIRGFSEFYGRRFFVNEQVLEPRPESEAMIDLLKQYAPDKARVADIGTGSGALAITAYLELPDPVVWAVDIDEACLDVAKRNAVQHTASITCIQGDLLEPFIKLKSSLKPTVLLCNLPYVPTDYAVNAAAQHEPGLALYGGKDGLDLFRKLFLQSAKLKPELVLTESLPEQHAALDQIASSAGFQLVADADFIQVFAPA